MYRKTAILIGISLLQIISYSQTGFFQITAQLSNFRPTEFVYLLKGEIPPFDKSKWDIIDSVLPKAGKFFFKLKLSNPNFYSIALTGNRWCSFIAEPNKKINIAGDANNLIWADVKGTYNNDIVKRLIKAQRPLIEQMNAYADSAMARGEKDSIGYAKYVKLNQQWADKIKQLQLQNINTQSKSFIALKNMSIYYNEFSKEKVAAFLRNLPNNLKNHPIAKEIHYNKFQKEVDLGRIKKIYDIVMFDTLKRSIDFTSYYGNIVLVDFWASWCKPCIANFPAIEAVYNKYKSLNFKILSVSLDANMEQWKKGLATAPSLWDNVSDLKGWQSLLVSYMKIESIPRYALLDTDGSFLSTDVPISEIDALLAKHLKKQ